MANKPRKIPTKIEIADDQLRKIAVLLEEKIAREKREQKYASTKEVLSLLAQGAILAFSLVAPNIVRLLKDFEKKPDKNAWKRFNFSYLRRTLNRLEKQKLIETKSKGKEQIVKITKRGKIRVLKYALKELTLEKPPHWDGNWRVVIYDIPNYLHLDRDRIRRILKELDFIEIQKSVYLTPFPCADQIEFLRSLFRLGKHIKLLIVKGLEDEKAYKEYFGI